jgi:predicted DCC family thiol-disulfide oxidoreductase YuxK
MEKGIVIFDGYCNFCSNSVRFIIKRDPKGHFRFAASQTPAGQAIVERHRLGRLAQHSIILLEKGRVYQQSTAALRIARHLTKGWWLFYGFIIIPRGIRDYLYDLIARNRYRIFGMREQCFVPDPGERDRFLQYP